MTGVRLGRRSAEVGYWVISAALCRSAAVVGMICHWQIAQRPMTQRAVMRSTASRLGLLRVHARSRVYFGHIALWQCFLAPVAPAIARRSCTPGTLSFTRSNFLRDYLLHTRLGVPLSNSETLSTYGANETSTDSTTTMEFHRRTALHVHFPRFARVTRRGAHITSVAPTFIREKLEYAFGITFPRALLRTCRLEHLGCWRDFL